MKAKRNSVIIRTLLLTALSVLICFVLNPVFKNLKYGLDLQGGFEILYQVTPLDGSKMTKEKLTSTYHSMSRRIDSLGVSEPEIILEGNDKIRVRLAGVTNQEEARETLSTVASLTFRDTNDNLLMTSEVLESGGARLTTDSNGRPAVALSIADVDTFYEVTNRVKDYEDNRIVIWLDFEEGTDSYAASQYTCGTESSHCLSAATVNQAFASDVIIQGNFTEEQAQNLVDLINSGSLPAKLTEVSSQTVGASFGEATLQKTLIAGIVGISLVALLLIFVYHFAGFISSVCILLYTLLVFAVFWLVGGVLTLPGIAALLLGIGMAVDANVLTYARIKEELQKGRSLESAFKNGSKASFTTILDANLTTLLVAIIMFIFGESSVKGFATMLIINIAVTMVTMVGITRMMMKGFVKTGYFDDKLNLFLHVKKKDLEKETLEKKPKNYLRMSKYFAIFSCVCILIGTVFFGVKGFHLGIDYQAGSDITLVSSNPISESSLDADLESLGLTKVSYEAGDGEVSLRVKDVLADDEIAEVTNYFTNKYQADVDIGVVSNIVAQELIKNAAISIALSLIGIILYVSFRFTFHFGLSSVLCLIHDALMMVAGILIFQVEVNSMFIVAILTIIGYSINNTIVVFDRIRENRKKKDSAKLKEGELEDLVNLSIGQTMSRSIYTSLTTLLPIIALMIFGSSGILTFNVAMVIGLIAGTYSSIFLAGYIYVKLEKRSAKKNKPKKIRRQEVQEKIIKGIND
ncbi:MAG TPA: protein translocase subunit SecD [Candidatus Onthousia faecigallinarum]|nr:protein translocase subunit SecD [Candidatus Onthousia faecigallinarum]